MSEKHKELVRRYMGQVIGQHKLELIDELWTPDLIWHGGALGEVHGREGLKQFLSVFASAFPDMSATEEATIAENDLVSSRWTIHATHTGALMGIPPTNLKLSWGGIEFYRIENGQIAEEWAGDDTLSILQQLGVAPKIGG